MASVVLSVKSFNRLLMSRGDRAPVRVAGVVELGGRKAKYLVGRDSMDQLGHIRLLSCLCSAYGFYIL